MVVFSHDAVITRSLMGAKGDSDGTNMQQCEKQEAHRRYSL